MCRQTEEEVGPTVPYENAIYVTFRAIIGDI